MPAPVFGRHVERLASRRQWAYHASPESAAEPAAWATLALVSHGEVEAAARAARWLASLQQTDGAIGLSAEQAEPRWATGLALAAWSAVDRLADAPQFRENVERASQWALADRGKTAPRSPEVGHDTTLVGWSWAANTHSWLEPTSMFVLGLKASGFGDHVRVREGVRLIVDRLLPSGGANYGNTTVFGNTLLPHLEPSGLAMLALAGENVADPRVDKTLAYLAGEATAETSPISLSYALLGLTARGRRPGAAGDWALNALDHKAESQIADYELALLLLAGECGAGWIHGLGGRGNSQAASPAVAPTGEGKATT